MATPPSPRHSKAAGHGGTLREAEAILAACAEGAVPSGRPLADLPLDEEERRMLTRVILWEDRLDHAKALVAAGIDPNLPEEMGMTPLHLAGWAGLRDHVAWLLTLKPDLDHVNDYGGDIVGTIVHGSENRLDAEERDHIGCARLVLEAGAALRRAESRGCHARGDGGLPFGLGGRPSRSGRRGQGQLNLGRPVSRRLLMTPFSGPVLVSGHGRRHHRSGLAFLRGLARRLRIRAAIAAERLGAEGPCRHGGQ